MTRSFPVPIMYKPCKRLRLSVGATIVVPIIKANQPVLERPDGTRSCITRLVAADLLRMYRVRS